MSSVVMHCMRGRCRTLLIGFALGISPQTHAVDLTPDASRILSDPAFVPSARQLIGATTYGYSKDSADVVGTSAASQYSLVRRVGGVSQAFSYGITDELSVWGGESYSWSTTEYDFGSGADTSIRRYYRQLQIGVTDRLIDQRNHDFNLDVSAYAPGGVNIAISRTMTDLTLRGSAGIYHVGYENGIDEVRDFNVTVNRYWGYFFSLQSEMRLTRFLAFDVSAAYDSANVNSVHASSSGGSFAIDYPNQVDLGLALSYQLIPDKWVAKLGLGYGFLGTRRDVYADPSLDVQTAHRSVRSIGLSLFYSL